jgi:hypothetical protein
MYPNSPPMSMNTQEVVTASTVYENVSVTRDNQNLYPVPVISKIVTGTIY